MKPELEMCMVIPCFNEENRLPLNEYTAFIESNSGVLLCFVNDGSSDKTLEILSGLKQKYPEYVDFVSYAQNAGKAEAVRQGMIHCNEKYSHKFIAYLDADLATTLEECFEMRKNLNDNIHFCFGSRILRIGSVIERKGYRFLIGRFIATCISNILDLKVYDTQCGCKLFQKDLSQKIFSEPFISKWLFDVEIFFRMKVLYGRNEAILKMLEVPLLKWIDKGESKVKFSYFFKLWCDLYNINQMYKFRIRNSNKS